MSLDLCSCKLKVLREIVIVVLFPCLTFSLVFLRCLLMCLHRSDSPLKGSFIPREDL